MPATWPERNHSAGPFLPAKMDLFLAAINKQNPIGMARRLRQAIEIGGESPLLRA
jgi:hypothetical protein